MTFAPPPSLFEFERNAFWTSLIKIVDREESRVNYIKRQKLTIQNSKSRKLTI